MAPKRLTSRNVRRTRLEQQSRVLSGPVGIGVIAENPDRLRGAAELIARHRWLPLLSACSQTTLTTTVASLLTGLIFIPGSARQRS